MSTRRVLIATLTGLALLGLTFACGGGSSTPPPPPPAPTITSFTAAKATLTSGDNTTLTAVFANGTGSVDGGVGAVASGTAANVTPSATTTYTLTVTNSANKSLSQTTTVTVVAAPIVPVVSAPANVTAGQAGYTASTPVQTGTTYAWTLSNGTLTAGAGTSSITFTAGASGSVGFICVATNAAGTASAASNGSSTIVSAPSTPMITAPANVTANLTGYTASTPAQAGSTYAWAITGGAITAGATTDQITFAAGASGNVVLGCVVTNAAGTLSTQGTASSTIVSAPTAPEITAPASVTANQGGYTASTPAQAGVAFAWTLTGGTVTAGAGTNNIIFTAGASGIVGINCVATNSAGTASAAGTANATIIPAPTTPVITAPASVTANGTGYSASTPAQTGVTFAWTLTGGTITAGAGANSITFTAGASGAIGFNCIATNGLGVSSAAGTATSTIVAGPTQPVITAPVNVTANLGGYTSSTPAQTGVTFAWTLTGGTVTAGAGTNSITFTAGATGNVSFSCVATNGANVSSAAGTASSTIVAAPSISAFSASPASITAGSGSILSASYSGGTGVVTPGNSPLPSGGTLNVSPTSTTLYTLTVTNAAKTATTATATVTVTAAPVLAITSFSAMPASVDYGGNTTLDWVLAGTPTTLTLDGANVFGATTAPAQPIRRQAYTLQASDGVRTVASTVKVPARGLDLLAGHVGGAGWQDGQGANARFNFPEGVAIDGAGNLYVADTYNNTIRRISSTGLVSTLAGTYGVAGSTDATGTAASFNMPAGVAVDSSGNVYVADTYNHTIRKITPAGVVSTLAGSAGLAGSTNGTKSAARFNYPGGLTVDASGTVYVADTGNNTIRKITPAGAVTRFVGPSSGVAGSADGTGSAARFSGPTGVAVDTSGILYVADSNNATIRRITSAGVVTTLAGSAGVVGNVDGTGTAARFSYPSGVAVDASGTVFVADSIASIIRKITPLGDVTTLAGIPGAFGTLDGPVATALFGGPNGLVADGSGNLYVADSGPNLIRRISSAGLVSTLAGASGDPVSLDGTGTNAGFNSPQGLAVDAAGNTYVADYWNSSLRKITPSGVVTTVATGFAPSATAVDAAGNIFVSDANNSVILKVSPSGVVTTLAGNAGVPGSVDGTGTAAEFNSPYGVAVDASGNVYVADWGNGTIRQITPAGVVTTLAGTAGVQGSADGTGTAATFFFPQGVAVDGVGNVYVTDNGNLDIRKITPAGVVTRLAGSVGIQGYVDATGTAAQFGAPVALAVDAAGTVYVSDLTNNAIRRITPDGVVTTVAGGGALVVSAYTAFGPLPAAVGTPVGIALTPDGDLVVSTLNGVVQITAP